MAEKKIEKKKIEEKEEPVNEVMFEAEAETITVDPVKVKAGLIFSLFDEIKDVEGVPFDSSVPEHLIVAAFLVGSRGMLRR